MSFNFEFLDKMDILAATGQFWPKFWLRGTRPSLFWAITFEPIKIQTSTTHQNLDIFMLFHFVPNNFPLKSIVHPQIDRNCILAEKWPPSWFFGLLLMEIAKIIFLNFLYSYLTYLKGNVRCH